MNALKSQTSVDIWKEWLLVRRFGGDPDKMEQALAEFLIPVRDRVLEHADLGENDMLLDVGCGDGLIAFGALDRLPFVQVIFSDISRGLLDHAQALAKQMGVARRSRFLEASAEDLSAIPDGSVDVVTTRSVLIFVKDKSRAFQEFFRVLKPGGRISLYEPINRFSYPPPRNLFLGFDVTPIIEITDKLKAVYAALQPVESDPMLDFDERDLVDLAEAAGFEELDLELKIEIKPFPKDQTWENLLNIAGNPKIPTLAEAIEQVLTETEKRRFSDYMRPRVEKGDGKRRMAQVFLWARKG